MTITEHMPQVSTGAVIGVLVLLGVAGGGGYWMGQATAERPPADTVQVEREGTAEDLPDATIPDVLTQYEAPDTTVQECIQVPRWLAKTQQPDSLKPSATRPSQRRPSTSEVRPSRKKASPDTSANGSGWTPQFRLGALSAQSAGLSYDIIPTRSGRPIVSVTRHEVQTSTIDPETGALSTWTWDIERPDNRFAAFAEAGALPLGAYALTGVQYTRDLGRVDFWGLTLDTQLSAAGGQAWTTQGAGPALRTGLSIGLKW
jgi:hypothetical protein